MNVSCCPGQLFERHPNPEIADIGQGGGAEYTVGRCKNCGAVLVHCWVGGVAGCLQVVSQDLIDSFLAVAPEPRKKLMALGAHPGNILSLVLRRGMKLTLIGMALGLMGAVASTRLLRDMLFGIKPVDPLTFAAMTLLIMCISLVACFLPARRATKVDPMNVLRSE